MADMPDDKVAKTPSEARASSAAKTPEPQAAPSGPELEPEAELGDFDFSDDGLDLEDDDFDDEFVDAVREAEAPGPRAALRQGPDKSAAITTGGPQRAGAGTAAPAATDPLATDNDDDEFSLELSEDDSLGLDSLHADPTAEPGERPEFARPNFVRGDTDKSVGIPSAAAGDDRLTSAMEVPHQVAVGKGFGSEPATAPSPLGNLEGALERSTVPPPKFPAPNQIAGLKSAHTAAHHALGTPSTSSPEATAEASEQDAIAAARGAGADAGMANGSATGLFSRVAKRLAPRESGLHAAPPTSSVSSGVLTYSTRLGAALTRLDLPQAAHRMAAELADELSTTSQSARALYAHLAAEAVRTSLSPEAIEVAAEFEQAALSAIPTYLPAHLALIADAWRSGDWARCTDLLHRFIARLEQLASRDARLSRQLPGAYLQLELLLEQAVGQSVENLKELVTRASTLPEPSLLAPLSAARHALMSKDPVALTEAYEAWIELVPHDLARALAIDLICHVWHEEGDVAHARAVYNTFSGLGFEDPLHTATLEILAWQTGDTQLEVEVGRLTVDYLHRRSEQLGRTDTLRRGATQRRVAALLYRRMQIAAAAEDAAAATQALSAASEVHGDNLLLAHEAYRVGMARGSLGDADAGLLRQLALIEDPKRRAILMHRRGQLAWQRGMSSRAATLFENALEEAPQFRPSLLALIHVISQSDDKGQLPSLYRRLASAASMPTPSDVLQAEAFEWVLDRPEEAFVVLGGADASLDRGYRVFRGVERAALTIGKHAELIALYSKAAYAAVLPARRRDLLWKGVQLMARVVGQDDDVVGAYELFLDLEPRHVPTLRALYEHQRASRRWSSAIALLQRILEEESAPDERRILLQESLELATLAHDEESLHRAQRALLALAPRDPLLVHQDRARALASPSAGFVAVDARADFTQLDQAQHLFSLGELAGAREALKKLVEPIEGANALLEEISLDEQDWQGWAEVLEQAAASLGGEAAAASLEFVGTLALDRFEDRQRALELYERALTLSPDNAIARTVTVDQAWQLGDWPGVIEGLTAQLEHTGEWTQRRVLLRELGFVAVCEGPAHDGVASQTFQELLESDTDLFALRSAAYRFRTHGDVPQLAEVFGRMAASVDTRAVRLYLLAESGRWSERARGQVDLDWLEALFRAYPEEPLADIALAQALTHGIAVQRLIDLFALRTQPDDKLGLALHLSCTSKLYESAGQLIHARDAMTKAVLASSTYLPALVSLIAIADALGDARAAAAACEDAARLLPAGRYRAALLEGALERWRAAGDHPRARAVALWLNDLPEALVADEVLFAPESSEFLVGFYETILEGTEDEAMLVAMHCELATLAEDDFDAPTMSSRACKHWRAASEIAPNLRFVRLALMRYAVSATLPQEEHNNLVEYLRGLSSTSELVELLLQEADRCERRADTDGAHKILEAVLDLRPRELRALHRLADLWWERGDALAALARLQRLAEAVDDLDLRSAIHLEIALRYDIALGERDEALLSALNGLSSNPSDPSLLRLAARLSEATGNIDRAAAFLVREAEQQLPGPNQRACFYRAASLYGRCLGKWERARAVLSRASYDVAETRAMLLWREMAHAVQAVPFDESVALLRLAANGKDAPARAHCRWVLGLAAQGDEAAGAAFRHALEDAPSFFPAALALERLGRRLQRPVLTTDGLRAWARATSHAPTLVLAGKIAEFELDDLEQAEADYLEALECPSTDLFGPLGAADALRRLYARTDRPEEEADVLDKLRASPMVASRKCSMVNRHADLLTALGEQSSAIVAWQEVLRADAMDGHAFNQLSALLSASGDYEALHALRSQEAQAVADSDPERGELLNWEATELLARKLGRTDEALELLWDAIEREPSAGQYVDSARRLMQETGNDVGLERLVTQQLDTAQELEKPILLLERAALFAGSLQDPERALADLTALAEFEPSSLYALDEALELAMRTGESGGLVERIRTVAAVERDERCRATLYVRLGEACEAAGDVAEARSAYWQAFEHDPTLETAAYAWERCSVEPAYREEHLEHLEALFNADPRGPRAGEVLTRAGHLMQGDEHKRALSALARVVPKHPFPLLVKFRAACLDDDLEALVQACMGLSMCFSDVELRLRFTEAAAAVLGLFDIKGAAIPDWQCLEDDPKNLMVMVRRIAALQPDSPLTERLQTLEFLKRGAWDEQSALSYEITHALHLAAHGKHSDASAVLDYVDKTQPGMLPVVKLMRYIAEADRHGNKVADLAEREAGLMSNPDARRRCLMHAGAVRRDKLDDPEGAARALNLILQEEPLHEGAFIALEGIYRDTEDAEKLHDLLNRRADALDDPLERKRLMARAAKIATGEMREPDTGADDWRRLIALDPSDAGAYEGLITLYSEARNWRAAVKALDQLADSSQDHEVKWTAYARQAAMLESNLEDARSAVEALERMRALRPDDDLTLRKLIDLLEGLNEHQRCLQALKRLLAIQDSDQGRVEVIHRLFDAILNWQGDPDAALELIVELRAIDPGDLSMLEQLAHWLTGKGLEARRQKIVQDTFDTYRRRFLKDPADALPLHVLFELAALLNDGDKAFVMASISVAAATAMEAEKLVYDKGNVQGVVGAAAAELPELLSKVMATGLSPSMIELMRIASPHVAKISPHTVWTRGLARKNRVRPSGRAEIAELVRHAEALGVELPPTYVVPIRGELPFFLAAKDEAIVLAESDLAARHLNMARFRVAAACAAIRLGVAPFAAVDFSTFVVFVASVVKATAPNQHTSLPPDLDAQAEVIGRAIPKKAAEQARPYVFNIMQMMSEQALWPEYRGLQLTRFMHAAVTMRDPAVALQTIGELSGATPTAIGEAVQEMISFLLSDTYFELRRRSGVAVI